MDFELLDSLIQSKKEQFWEMSDQIWGFAEMRVQGGPVLQAPDGVLRNEGFTVEEGIGDIPTAFQPELEAAARSSVFWANTMPFRSFPKRRT